MGSPGPATAEFTMTVLMTPDKANFSGKVHGGALLKKDLRLLEEVLGAGHPAAACISAAAERVLAAAATPRALSIARLTAAVAATGARPRVYSNLEAALAGAAAAARATDTVLVCGCFAAVAAALRQQTAGT